MKYLALHFYFTHNLIFSKDFERLFTSILWQRVLLIHITKTSSAEVKKSNLSDGV